MSAPLHCPCEGRHFRPVFVYDEPPPGETRFPLSEGAYHREVSRCDACGHFVSTHALDLDAFYRDEYVDSTYGADGLRAAFDRIVGLAPERSDNEGRVRRVAEFAASRLPAARMPTALDVGSGLCVFLHRLRELGWAGTALDPDPRAVEHARNVVGVDAVCGDFMEVDDLPQSDVVAFNKVLEHIADPVAMLARAARFVAPGGFVYVEVPDGDAAAGEGPEREEFFIEHLHVFSPSSLAETVNRAGFSLLRLERLREPSTKFTLVAFAEPVSAAAGLSYPRRVDGGSIP